MNLNLEGKNALVCGSSRGLGKATAIELSQLGANVTLVSRSADTLANVIKELDQSRGQHHDFLAADFTDIPDLKKKIRRLTMDKVINILVNNTGGPPGGALTEATAEAFLQAFNNHILCSHLLTQACVDGMKKSGYGRIVNIISTSVKEPIPMLGVSNATRGAMGNWSKTMASELGPHGITVNNVLPGYTMTGRLEEIITARANQRGVSEDQVIESMKANVPLRRFAQPAEVGSAVAFLSSPAAAYINGSNIVVDGGRTRSL